MNVQQRHLILAFVIMTAIAVAAYLPVLTNVYGYADDYLYIYWANLFGFERWNNQFSSAGRLLLGFILSTTFGVVCAQPEDLVWYRGLSVLGISLMGLCLWVVCRDLRLKSAAMALLISLLLLNPAIGAWAFFTMCFAYPIAAASVLAAGWLCRIEANRLSLESSALWSVGLRWGCAVITIVVACMLYQTTAFFFIVPALLLLFVRIKPENLVCFIISCAQLASGLAAYFFLYKLYVRFGISGDGDMARGEFGYDWLTQLSFFLNLPMQRVLGSWGTLLLPDHSSLIVLLSIAALTASLVFLFRWQKVPAWLIVLVVVSYVGAILYTSLTIWTLKHSYAPWRVLPPVVAVAWLPLVALLHHWLEKRDQVQSGPKPLGKWVTFFSWGCCILLLIVTNRGVYHAAVSHLKHELEVTRSHLASTHLSYPSALAIVPPHRNTVRIEGRRADDEYYDFAMFSEWSVKPMLVLALNRQFNRNKDNSNLHELTGLFVEVHQEDSVIDLNYPLEIFDAQAALGGSPIMRKPEDSNLLRETHPVLGELRQMSGNWWHSEHFGLIKIIERGTLDQVWLGKLGVIHIDTQTTGGLRFWRSDLQWARSSVELFPDYEIE